MAYSVINNGGGDVDISVVRGDTFIYQVKVYTDSQLLYIPAPGDTITFQVFRKYTDTTPLYEKRIPYDTMVLKLSATETGNMKFGNYVYCIKIRHHNGYVETVIKGDFRITTP